MNFIWKLIHKFKSRESINGKSLSPS